ncbi:MAG TPA: family 10 glycosylhydrolase [Candidatus Hydrogenedentes bacterium]|nr:family 10 glycosylhydrolase [Candidatus Hydrogenedentota bacterium]
MNVHLLITLSCAGCLFALSSLCRADEMARRPSPDGGARRFLFNNDGTNLFFRADLTLELIHAHVDECPKEITTYLLCPNGYQKMMYPSRHEEMVIVPAFRKLVEEGVDPFGAFLERVKQRGFETFVTFRINEVHNVHTPAFEQLSDFWRAHPEYRVERGEKPKDWMAQCLDFSLEPVREYTLALLREIIEKYDIDGIELDFMRFPRHLSGIPGEVWEKRGDLTELVARTRAAADARAEQRGRPFLVAVRIPTSLVGCRHLGVNVAEWTRRGLVDFVTVSPFLSTDFFMPIEEVREAMGGHAVPIYAGIEFGYSGNAHSEASIRAAALGLYDSGADGIYLFNFPCWREGNVEPPFEWLPQLRDPNLMKGKGLLFPLNKNIHRIPNIDLPVPLPIHLAPSETGTLPLWLPASIRADDAEPDAAVLKLSPVQDLDVTFNGAKLQGIQDAFSVAPGLLKPGNNTITMTNHADEAVIVDGLALEIRHTESRRPITNGQK